MRLQIFGSTRCLPDEVVSRLGQLEELGCTSMLTSGSIFLSGRHHHHLEMLFPPAVVCKGGLPVVRAFFAAEAVDIELQGSGICAEDVADLGAALAKVCVRSIDISNNEALGTSGAARLLEVVDTGVKSVSLKGTGLGFAERLPGRQQPVVCIDDDWGRLEGALRGLSALEAIDVSDNVSLGMSGLGRLVSCCAGEVLLFVIT